VASAVFVDVRPDDLASVVDPKGSGQIAPGTSRVVYSPSHSRKPWRLPAASS
jgi:hypothetical protein